MTDRTAAALASALPAGIIYGLRELDHPWRAQQIAKHQAERLAESGWRLVHADDDGTGPVRLSGHQTFAEHTAEALALIHDHVEVSE